jgi:hypothetical protein
MDVLVMEGCSCRGHFVPVWIPCEFVFNCPFMLLARCKSAFLLHASKLTQNNVFRLVFNPCIGRDVTIDIHTVWRETLRWQPA